VEEVVNAVTLVSRIRHRRGWRSPVTIAERKAREAYDRLNPWRPMKEPRPDGTVCELLFSDIVGSFDADQRRYFLDTSGDWYSLDPP
jgi:hypothetical protein